MNLPAFLTRHADGEIRLTGHRIDLYLIVSLHDQGYTTEMLAEEYPTLPLDLIHNVIAFCQEDRREVDAYLARVQAKINQFRAGYQPGPGITRIRRLMEERARAGERS
jgi:uncharacterized protein (DUF433 family)